MQTFSGPNLVPFDFKFMSDDRAVVPAVPLKTANLQFTLVRPATYVFIKIAVGAGYVYDSIAMLVTEPWGSAMCSTNCTSPGASPCLNGGTCNTLLGSCTCPLGSSFFGDRCQFGCAASKTFANYSVEFDDGTRRVSDAVDLLPANVFTNCLFKFVSTYKLVDGLHISFVEFNIDPNNPLRLTDASGGVTTLKGSSIPQDIILPGANFTMQYTSGFFQPTFGFKVRVHSLGCPAGSFINQTIDFNGAYSAACQTCPVGTFSSTRDSHACEPCRPGSYGSETGMSSCTMTSFGQYQDVVGQTSPKLCPPGSVAGDVGAAACVPCLPGFAAPERGMRACTRCNQSSYSDQAGSSECTLCPPFTASVAVGADALEWCECAREYYHQDGLKGVACQPCPVGALCEGGSETRPKALPGYWMSKSNPYTLYRCVTAASCPGGPPESCSDGRTGHLCSTCPSGSAIAGSGCTKCGASSKALLPIILLVSIGLLTILYKTANSNDPDNLRATIGLGTVCGLALQVCAAQSCYLLELFGLVWFGFLFFAPISVD